MHKIENRETQEQGNTDFSGSTAIVACKLITYSDIIAINKWASEILSNLKEMAHLLGFPTNGGHAAVTN